MPTRVTDIPRIMRAQGWDRAPKLMDKWLSGPANSGGSSKVDSRSLNPDFSTIDMAWVLGFGRAKKAYDEAMAERLWLNENARKRIVEVLTNRHILKPSSAREARQSFHFDNTTQRNPASITRENVVAIEADYITYVKIGNPVLDPLDELFGALGTFTLHFCLSGTVTTEGQEGMVRVERVGAYVSDRYDFRKSDSLLSAVSPGGQPLGVWRARDNSFGKAMLMPMLETEIQSGSIEQLFGQPPTGNPLTHLSIEVPTGLDTGTWFTNSTFREYQARHSRGEDFFVYSDIRHTEVQQAEFEISSSGPGGWTPARTGWF